MIKEIQIENFKSIQSLNLELGRLNVFIGANGSGKSNILEAIAFGSAAAEDKLDNEFFENRGIRASDSRVFHSGFKKFNGNNDIIKLSFKNNNENPINFQARSINPTAQKWVYQINFEDNTLVKVGNELWNIKNDKLVKKYPIGELFGSLLNFLIYAPENTCLRDFKDKGTIEPLDVKGKGLFNHISDIFKEKPDLFQKINENLRLLDWFDGFEIPNDLMFTERRIKIKDQYLEDGLQYFDQRSANEGFLYLLFYLTLFISDETPKFFAIDNIDNAMNPKMGSELVNLLAKLAKEHDKQVILTTHNPSILDGLDLEDDEQRLFVVSRNKLGHTKVLRVPYRESEERLSYSFIRGSIGGLPKNF